MLGKYYSYVFYLIYRIYKKLPNEWWSPWKAVLTISFLEMVLVLDLLNLVDIYFIVFPELFENEFAPALMGGVIYLYNHIYFLYRNSWKSKIERFKGYNKRLVNTHTVFIAILGSLILALFVFTLTLYADSSIARTARTILPDNYGLIKNYFNLF
jgi:hypothetical protein